MPAKNRPSTDQLFPGLNRRAGEARRQEAAAEEETTAGRGRRAVLRTQEEIERDLRSMPEGEREAILSSSNLNAEMADLRDQIRYVDIGKVHPNPEQPRKSFDPAQMDELVESIRVHGVLSPIHVQALPDGTYRIIAGERRWRAARRAGRTNIPVIVKTVDDAEALELALLENLHRADLSALEESRTYQFMMDQFAYTQAQLAERIGKKQSYISKTLALLDLPAKIQALMLPPDEENIPRGINGEPMQPALLSAGAAMVISRVIDPDVQLEIAHRTIEEGLSVRQVETLVREWKEQSAQEAAAMNARIRGEEPPTAPRRNQATYPAFHRPEPAGPQVRFNDLSMFNLYREVGRIATVDLARLEDALRTDLELIAQYRAETEAAMGESDANPAETPRPVVDPRARARHQAG
jgi:ParB family chromosome partitioning protein